MKNLKLPVGIEDFQEIRRNGFYYIDKTGLIEQLLDSLGKVNLFTRPCRFGKSLNMSMLRYFFEIGTDMTLFNGLHIMQRKDLCDEYMGRFPVVFLTLKGVDGLTFEKATNKLIKIVALEAERFIFLKNSDKLTDNEKQRYCALVKMQDGKYAMDEDTLESALQTLSELLYRHYGQKVVILVDEYDVPLHKAYQNGYYKEMVSMIRSLFGEALKTNEFLQFAVLTGCLRVSRESIFTGLNNFKIFSITDARFDEQFGFTEDEVGKMLKDYHLEEHLAEMKEWYDGYHFGDADIYCPWDVINRVDDLCDTPEAKPKCYWINSSGNALVKRFVSIANRTTQDEIEHLIAGEPIEKSVRLDLTYDEIDKSIDNIWSVLFTTGYLTQADMTEQGAYKLVIPNKEVRTVYISQIQEWFKQKIADNTEQMAHFWKAIEDGNAEIIEQYLNQTLSNTISVFDTKAPEKEKKLEKDLRILSLNRRIRMMVLSLNLCILRKLQG